MINIILAIDKNNLLGNNQEENGLPWRYQEDLKYFKEKVKNKKCIVGRKTYTKIKDFFLNQKLIVLSNNKNFVVKEKDILLKYEEVINNYKNSNEEVFVIGGSSIYELFWNDAKYIYITRINKYHQGNIYFNNYSFDNFKLIDNYYFNSILKLEVWKKNS